MIHYLRKEEKYRSEALWKEAFPEDSASFRAYYYREKAEENQILVMEENGKIVSMLHRNPYQMAAGHCLWDCDYLVGIATAWEGRRKGYMRKLMERALADMRSEHMPFCFLMPAFKELYLPFGFAYIFDRQEWRLKSEESLQKRLLTDRDMETAARWMRDWLDEYYELYALRSEAYLDRLRKELQSEDGVMELLFSGAELAGIRAEWGLGQRELRMLMCEPNYRQSSGEAEPCMMGRIVDLEMFVKAIRLCREAEENELTVFLQVEDGQLEENDGTWRWHLDKKGSFAEKVLDGKGQTPDLRLTIGSLTAWLTGYSVPESAMRYVGKIRPMAGSFFDEIV